MKVVLVNALYYPHELGGAERSVRVLAEALVGQSIEAVVVTIRRRGESHTAIHNGVRIVRLDSRRWLPSPYADSTPPGLARKLWHLADIYDPAMRRRVQRLLQAEAPDLVHTNNLQSFSISVWHAARTLGLPVVHTLRDYYLACARATRFRDTRSCATTCTECKLFCATRRRAAVAIDAVVGNSRFILDEHVRLGFFSSVPTRTQIASACDLTIPASRSEPRSPLLTFGYLGRLEAIKGIGELINAFGRRSDNGWRLLIAGSASGGGERRWQEQLAELPAASQIELLGEVDASGFLSRLDVLVVPSLWDEPLPRSILEANAFGLPVLASNRGGIPEVVAHERTGLLFDPAAPGSLEAAIDRLISEPELLARLGADARARRADWSPARSATAYVEVYRATLARRRLHS